MIANITKGRRAQGALAYDFGPGHREEHVDPRFVAGNVPGTRQQVGRLIDHHTAQADAKKPIWRCSLSLPGDDGVLPDATWGQIATEFVTEMGFADCPWVAVRHGDNHVHLTVSRVSWDGTLASDQWDYARARKAADAIEARYGLAAARDHFREAGPGVRSGAELAAAQRRGQDRPEREQLREKVRAARDSAAGGGRPAFEKALTDAGVSFRANVASTGRMNGYSFTQPGWRNAEGEQIWVKASEMGKDLAWSKLHPALTVGQLRAETEAKLAAAKQQASGTPDLAHRLLDSYRAVGQGEQPPNAEGDYELARPTIPPIERRRFGLLDNRELTRRHQAALRNVAWTQARYDSEVKRSHRMDAALSGGDPWNGVAELVQRRRQLEAAAGHQRAAAEHEKRAAKALEESHAAERRAVESEAQAKNLAPRLWLRGTNRDEQRDQAEQLRAEARRQDETWVRERTAAQDEKAAARQAAPPGCHNITRERDELVRDWPRLVDQARAQDEDFLQRARPGQARSEEYARAAAEKARNDALDLVAELKLRQTMPSDWAKNEATARGQAALAGRAAAGKSSTPKRRGGTPTGQPSRTGGQPKPPAPKQDRGAGGIGR